jgi:protein TonB
MSPRLLFAFALSFALHSAFLAPDVLQRPPVTPPRPPLLAALRIPPKAELPPPEPLLKNTLTEGTEPTAAPPPAARTTQKPAPTRLTKQVEIAVEERLAQHVYYPPEAVARGIEGEVRLILRLTADGAVDEVSIAASSGHTILDNAAIKAAYAMGRIDDVRSRELILPVIFRLQE